MKIHPALGYEEAIFYDPLRTLNPTNVERIIHLL